MTVSYTTKPRKWTWALELQKTYRNFDLWTAEFSALNTRKLGFLYSSSHICNFLLYLWRENSSVLVLSKLPVLIINRSFVQWIMTEMALFVLNNYLFSVCETLQLYLLVVLDNVCLIFPDVIYLSTLVVTQKIKLLAAVLSSSQFPFFSVLTLISP